MPKGNSYKTSTLDTNLTGTKYLALFQTNPGPTGTGTEVTYSGYARKPITWGAAVINGSVGEKKNTNLHSCSFLARLFSRALATRWQLLRFTGARKARAEKVLRSNI